MITMVIVLAAVCLMVIFSVQNAAPVVVSFLSWKFEASLAVIILLCVLTGILIGGATASFWRLKRSIKNRKAAARGPMDGKQPL
jgi:putative membrane protein